MADDSRPAPAHPAPAPPTPVMEIAGPHVEVKAGSNDGKGTVAQPHVAVVRPPVAGEVTVNRGAEADYFVAIDITGHRAGSRIAKGDLPAGADVDWLTRSGALVPTAPQVKGK